MNEYRGVDYLIVVDYFLSYPWILSLKNITSKSAIGALKIIFTELIYNSSIQIQDLSTHQMSYVPPTT